jgi:aminopeptidase N
VKHLALDVVLDVPRRGLDGVAKLTVARVDPSATELELDAIAFELTRVEVAGKKVNYVYDGAKLIVPLSLGTDAFDIEIAYRATPRRGIFFLAPDDQVPMRPRQVWTQCQDEDARYWFPCHDKPHVKMTTELAATVPNGWRVLSNGELASSETPKEGNWRFHWMMKDPHPSYLLTLVAGEFDVVEEEACGVPLSYWVPRGRLADVSRTFGRTADMVKLFNDVTGVAYPWNKYAQIVVHDYPGGGMENTTATTLYEHTLLDARAEADITSDDLIAHELAHQWFGDLVTCRDWSEGWLNEGFATHLEHVWREHALGVDEYFYGLKADLESYASEANGRYRRPVVCADYDAPMDLFDRHLYEKGSLILHALKTELGPALFWSGVQSYLRKFQKGVVETRDLWRELEAVSGRSLGKVIDQCVYKPGHPILEVSVHWERGVLTLSVKQAQPATDGVPSAFEVPLVIDVADELGVRRERLLVTQRAQVLAVFAAVRPRFVVVDPEMQVVGEVRLKAPADMLRAQLSGAKTARGRWLAAAALGQDDDPLSIEALAHVLRDKARFWGERAEAAAALGSIRAPECYEVLSSLVKEGAREQHPKVRRAIVAALGKFRKAELVTLLRPLALFDESYLVQAASVRSLGASKQEGAFDTLVSALSLDSWADVVRASAVDGLAALRDTRGVPHVQAHMRYGNSERVRRAAALALVKLSPDAKAREALEEALLDSYPNVRFDAVRALGELGDVKARGALRDVVDRDLEPRVRRRAREALVELADSKKAHSEWRVDMDKVLDEQSELKARLAKLEARFSKIDRKPVPSAKTARARAVASRGPAKKIAKKGKQ